MSKFRNSCVALKFYFVSRMMLFAQHTVEQKYKETIFGAGYVTVWLHNDSVFI